MWGLVVLGTAAGVCESVEVALQCLSTKAAGDMDFYLFIPTNNDFHEKSIKSAIDTLAVPFPTVRLGVDSDCTRRSPRSAKA